MYRMLFNSLPRNTQTHQIFHCSPNVYYFDSIHHISKKTTDSNEEDNTIHFSGSILHTGLYLLVTNVEVRVQDCVPD